MFFLDRTKKVAKVLDRFNDKLCFISGQELGYHFS